MSFFEDTPFISSGSPSIDGVSTVLFVGFVLSAVIGVAYHFIHALIDAQPVRATGRGRRANPKRKVRTTEVNIFLAIALIALVAVTWLRFEHRRLKLASWNDIERWRLAHPNVPVVGKEGEKPVFDAAMEFTDKLTHAPEIDLSSVHAPSMGEVKHAVDGTVKGVKHAAEGVVKGAKKTWNVAKNAYIPSVQEIEDAAAHSFHRGTKKAKKSTEETAKTAAKTAKDWGKQSSEWIMDNVAIPKEFAYKFPWSPCGPRRRTSVWDFFKTLVDEYRHFWWTQQWLSGYLAWAVFVGIESRNRNLPPKLSFDFMVLGYCFSLAATQSLFYAMLLLQPAPQKHRQQSWVPDKAVVVVPIVLEMLAIMHLPKAQHWVEQQSASRFFKTAERFSAVKWFNCVQAFVIVWPALIAVAMQTYLPVSWGTRLSSLAQAKKYLSVVWYIIAIAVLVLHVSTTLNALREAWRDASWISWFVGLHRFRKAEGEKSSAVWSILVTLGDHSWLSALGWDVLLSAASLCLWSVFSSASVLGMVKCTLWPWLDETVEFAQDSAEALQDATEPYLDAMQERVEYVQEAAAPYAKDVRKRAKRAIKNAEPYLETAANYVGDGLDQMRRLKEDAVNAAKAQLNQQSDDAESPDDQDEISEREVVYEDEDEDEDESEWMDSRKYRGVSPKKRGRPAKGSKRSPSKSPAPPAGRQTSSRSRSRTSERQAAPSKRRSTRLQKLTAAQLKAQAAKQERKPDGEGTEPWYSRMSLGSVKVPTLQAPAVEVPGGVTDGVEAVGLTWGLFFLGGLGLASVGVFGADETNEE